MKLKKGDRAPEFSIKDISGEEISLKDYRGEKVLVSFFRYASCPFCNLRIHGLISKHKSFEKKGLKIVAFFQSEREKILEYVGKQKAPFPIIPDPSHSMYKKYGVEISSRVKFMKGLGQIGKMNQARKLGFKGGTKEGSLYLVPADFLIDERGKVLIAYYGKDISDHLDIGVIEGKL